MFPACIKQFIKLALCFLLNLDDIDIQNSVKSRIYCNSLPFMVNTLCAATVPLNCHLGTHNYHVIASICKDFLYAFLPK